jgi:adenosylhomocysteine nucleosidase
MIGLLFATKIEARPFLAASRPIAMDGWPISVYRIASMPWLMVAISGMGKVAAAAACQMMIRELKCSEIINAGAAGALVSGRRFMPGQLFCITSAVEGDHELLGKAPQPLLSNGGADWDLPAARLVTCDIPVFEAQRRQTLAGIGDLVDMEGAAIARVAALFDTPWAMVKGVSDAAGPTDRDTLFGNLKMVSQRIGDYLREHLQHALKV